MFDTFILIILFILLQPGILLTLPPIGKKIFMSGKSNFVSACVHGIIFAILLHLLNITEGFRTQPPTRPPTPPNCPLTTCPAEQYPGGARTLVTNPAGSGQCYSKTCIACYPSTIASSKVGVTSINIERSCPAGSYFVNITNKPDHTCPAPPPTWGKCYNCPINKYCVGGSEPPSSCPSDPPLTSTNNAYIRASGPTNASECWILCPQGYYCTSINSSLKKSCPSGASCPPGTRVPSGYKRNTVAGFFSGNQIKKCSASEYCPRNNTGPTPVVNIGQTSSVGSQGSSLV